MSTHDGEGQIVPFATTLQEVGGGKAATRAAELLHQCTAAVLATGRKATMTITVEVAPYRKGNTDTLDISIKSVAKLPEGDDATASGIFFPTRDGNLSRHDPQQLQLPLRAVETPRSNAR